MKLLLGSTDICHSTVPSFWSHRPQLDAETQLRISGIVPEVEIEKLPFPTEIGEFNQLIVLYP
jgi:hypothetical protein